MALLVTSPAAVQEMKLDAIVAEICQRANDPFQDNYQDRARELFIASVFQQINDTKWTRFDYHGLVGSEEFNTAVGADERQYIVLGKNNEIEPGKYIVNIIDVVSTDVSENNTATRKFVPIDTSEANRIATDEELEPIIGEVYWYMAGQKLFFHPNPNESMELLSFIIEYIVNPETFQEEENMLEFFSVAYVYEAIEIATGKLLAEIGLA